MKVLITGATGLVGNELTALCLENNLEVNYLTTRQDKLKSIEGAQGFYWNPTTNDIDIKCFEGVSAIVNLAGASIAKRWTKEYKEEIRTSRVVSLVTLRKGLEKSDVSAIKSFVSASAIGIYPNSLSDYYTEETRKVDDSFIGAIVQEWEQEIDNLNTFDFNIAKIRIGLVLSSKGGALPSMVKPLRNYVGAAFGTGKQWQSWIHIEDLARLFLFAVQNELQGVYNGVAPNPVTNVRLTKEIAAVLKKPLLLPNIPQIMMKGILGEMSYLLFASQRVSSKKIEDRGFNFNFKNIGNALEDLFQVEEKSDNIYNKEYV